MMDEGDKITLDAFNAKYECLENKADGNCLFLSIAQLDSRHSSKELRQMVCDFYKDFNANPSLYEPDSLLYNIANMKEAMNIEYNPRTNRANKITHEKRICKNLQYANVMDIFILSHLLKRPVVVYAKATYRSPNQMELLRVEKYSDRTNSDKPPLRLRYYGNQGEEFEEHYEAVILKSEGNNVPGPNPRKDPRQKKVSPKTKKASPPKAKKGKTPPKAKKGKTPPKAKKSKTPPKAKKSKTPPKARKSKTPPKTRKTRAEDNLIGRTIVKRFKDEDGFDENYIGTVVSYDPPYYKVIYEDDDTEEFTKQALKKHILA